MPWPQPPAPGVFCATPYHSAMRAIRADVERSLLRADWPAPPNVRAFTTLRGPAGDSAPPFDRFNLGLRSGDDASVVAGNRLMPCLPRMRCTEDVATDTSWKRFR